MLISLGDAVVSKRIKQFLHNTATEHWHIGETERFPDTYQSLTQKLDTTIVELDQLGIFDQEQTSDFALLWREKSKQSASKHIAYMKNCPWSDLKLFEILLNCLPFGCHLHLANSTPVRYIQLFPKREDIKYFSNRGVGGIDGSNSTAMGVASVSDTLNILVSGDMSFFYDSNAFWHRHIPPNFKVIIIQNGGGNIFRFIPGPDTTEILATAFEAHHPSTSIRDIARAYGLKYRGVHPEEDISQILLEFFQSETQILEIPTPRLKNAVVLRDYFEVMRSA